LPVVVRLGAIFIWVTIAALLGAVFSQLLGWEAVLTGVLIAWVVFVLLVVMTRGMRWTTALTLLSAGSLAGAVVSQLAGWLPGRNWFLLAWAVLLLPVAIALVSHPMRRPAWGLFIGFWGLVGVAWLIVIQVLAVTGVLSGGAYAGGAAWPLAVVGIWFLVASSLGFGCEEFPRWIDGLGLLAGAGLLGISVSTWLGGSADVTKAVGSIAAVAYCLWAIGLAWVLWRTPEVTHRFFGLAIEGAL
jgi:hypothetical protein